MSQNQILFLTSYPTRECGIATYSKDLINVITRKFSNAFTLKVGALENGNQYRIYPEEVKFILDTTDLDQYINLAKDINTDDEIKKVFVQHEFGLFGGEYGEYLLYLLYALHKPVSITFHTVLPRPEIKRKKIIKAIANTVEEIVVMTQQSSEILRKDYGISKKMITVIPHGTHIVLWREKQALKEAYGFQERLVLSTFGLLGPNKNIELALAALPKIKEQFPNVLYLVLGKTHPGIIEQDGEDYRIRLVDMVKELGLEQNVLFINKYLTLSNLLEYLSLTDIYLFTSKDPKQAVSGTFAYAMSSGCPIIATPIPHAKEVLSKNTGLLIDFEDPQILANAVIQLGTDHKLRNIMGRNAFHQTRATVWENAAIDHVRLFNRHISTTGNMEYDIPEISIEHIKTLTISMGIIQFSDICSPDVDSGYTLDDNARALIAVCMNYEHSRDKNDLPLIDTYLTFIEFCQKLNGQFVNYVDKDGNYHIKNSHVNLEDSNGRAIWSLGVVTNYQNILPYSFVKRAQTCLDNSVHWITRVLSPRAIGFIIKGLYFNYTTTHDERVSFYIKNLAEKLVSRYDIASRHDWKWYEDYLTYANSILPESMLYTYLVTKNELYRKIALDSFDFLLAKLFKGDQIKVISNQGWMQKDKTPNDHGEQPIDVSYTIQALDLFYRTFGKEEYRNKMKIAFSWFLGNNHLGQIIYNPVSGGCYDGLEKENVNLNQGAESTICYLIARLIMQKHTNVIEREINLPKTIMAKPLKLKTSSNQNRYPKVKRVNKQKIAV